jgi:hypothetical protein
VDDKDLTVADKEETFTYHTAIHGLSFKASDCTSKLIPKFGTATTTYKAVVVNIIAPVCNELHIELYAPNLLL